MKPAAVGRILFGSGCSLWIGHAGEPSDFHAHHAVQIALPFRGGAVAFREPEGEWRSHAAAVIPADQVHAFEARSRFMAQLFVEPESVRGRALKERFGSEGIAELPVAPLGGSLEALAAAYERRATDAELLRLAQGLIDRIAGITAPGASVDSWVVKAIAHMRSRLDDPLALADVAAAAGLSAERFRHLFVSETGIGFRPYVLWLRIELALAAYVRGSTLTDAAATGGFADSPHFSRTFRRMFGIPPASVRPDQPFRSSPAQER